MGSRISNAQMPSPLKTMKLKIRVGTNVRKLNVDETVSSTTFRIPPGCRRTLDTPDGADHGKQEKLMGWQRRVPDRNPQAAFLWERDWGNTV